MIRGWEGSGRGVWARVGMAWTLEPAFHDDAATTIQYDIACPYLPNETGRFSCCCFSPMEWKVCLQLTVLLANTCEHVSMFYCFGELPYAGNSCRNMLTS